MAPKEVKYMLREMGPKPISTHQGSVPLENTDAVIAAIKAAGVKYFVIHVPHRTF